MALHTIDLPCIKDTWVDQRSPTATHGTDTTLLGGWATVANGVAQLIAFCRFNWSTFPSCKRITSLKLRIYSVNALSASGKETELFVNPAKAVWDENLNYNGANAVVGPGGRNYLVNVDVPGSQYIEIDISDIPGIADIANYGLYLGWNSSIDSWLQAGYITIQSREGANPPLLRLTYEDVPPDAPTPQNPINVYKDNKAILRFEWQYNDGVSGTQKKFDLQWSTDQINWTTVTQTTSRNYYDMPANTLPAGNIYWRVRCYNTYDEVGTYCGIQSFYAIGAPSKPIINSVQSNSARPIIVWSATGQQLYQVQVLSGDVIVYDSSNQPNISARQHKVMAFLADGTYTVKIRIKNEYSLWSEWGSASVIIATVKPAKPVFSVAKTKYGVQAKAIVNGADYALLYRDGKCIKKQTIKGIVDDNGQVVENLIGSDGDCEALSSAGPSKATVVLDSSTKVFGSNSYKITVDTSNDYHSYFYMRDGINTAPITAYGLAIGDYISISGYFKTSKGKARLYMLFFDANSVQLSSTYVVANSPSGFTRYVKRAVIPANTAKIRFQITLTDALDNAVFTGNGENTNVDGLMVQKITAADYALSDSGFLAKYPFGNKEAFIIDDNAVETGSEHTYKARVVTEGSVDVFNDSDPLAATANFKYALVAPVSDLANVFSFTRSLNSPPKRVYDSAPGGAMVQYSGRENPVFEPDEHMSTGLSCVFYLKTWAEVEAFKAIYRLKETVLYRDAKGRKIFGILSNLQVTDDRAGFIISFAIKEVDYYEKVEV